MERPGGGRLLRVYIDKLWSVLERQPDDAHPYSSRLPLPQRYVVPGGRFVEIYYWDSYFTMLGLEESGRHDLTLAMLANFAWLIERYGHVPNGNRSYYLSRSQPPLFAAMVATTGSLKEAVACMQQRGHVSVGQRVIMTKGDFTGPGGTNAMKLVTVGEF